jgi:hypothetical protein
MCPFRRVEDREAGPSALGLLLPPGRQTFLILRPRSLACDLVLLETPDSATLAALEALKAPGIAQKLYRALEQAFSVETTAHAEGLGFRLHVRIGPFALVVCTRRPGQPYQPQVFPDSQAAQAFGQGLAVILCPPADVDQEIYFNVRHFTP